MLRILTAFAALLFTVNAYPQDVERLRGQVVRLDGGILTFRTLDNRSVRIAVPREVTVFSLTKASYADLDFGTYVGSVSVRLGDDKYSPILRDSLSWLHRGFELRIIDESLRGIAVGHTKWDLTADSVMTHGWVDDQEDRVISIKYGPTEEEETDVEIPRDVQVTRMKRDDLGAVKPGARALVGVQRGPEGRYSAVFIFVGRDGVVPSM
jgi:hypothetical protein